MRSLIHIMVGLRVQKSESLSEPTEVCRRLLIGLSASFDVLCAKEIESSSDEE